MSEQNDFPAEKPSLRIAELTIENFRTFRERTVIPFCSGDAPADAIATFHGDNASGKSNAIAALRYFLQAVTVLLGSNSNVGYAGPGAVLSSGRFTIPRPDSPTEVRGPVEINGRFADARLGDVGVRIIPESGGVRVHAVGDVASWRSRSGNLIAALPRPFGPRSQPIAVISAGRRASWFVDEQLGGSIQPALAEALLETRLSRDPEQRARWRDFEEALLSVPAFAGMDISIDRRAKGGDPELTFERRGKLVLGLDELSSGERQLVVLFAGVLLANAAIVAIEEPELSLDARSQRLFYDFLARLVEKRRIDQTIIESHVAAFDGPDVIRFHRAPGGPTTVTREPTAGPEALDLAKKAEAQGAKPRWVTADGFTRLPDGMRDELHVGAGKHVWFLRGPERWEAWPEEELDKMLGGAPEARDE